MCSSPFRTVLQNLTGSDRVSPCPICGGEDTTLSAKDHVGFRYNSCGKVTLGNLFGRLLMPRHAKNSKE
jgi:hypothetical protein